jgi:hypothetical protein
MCYLPISVVPGQTWSLELKGLNVIVFGLVNQVSNMKLPYTVMKILMVLRTVKNSF